METTHGPLAKPPRTRCTASEGFTWHRHFAAWRPHCIQGRGYLQLAFRGSFKGDIGPCKGCISLEPKLVSALPSWAGT